MIDLALLAQLFVWLAVVCIFLASGQASLFHPATWYLAFHGLVFVARPMLVYYYDFDSSFSYMRFHPNNEEFVRTLAISSVGMIVLVMTCLLVGRTDVAFSNVSAPEFSEKQESALMLVTFLLLPLIAYSIHAASGDTGGELQPNGVYTLNKTTGYITDAQFMLAPLLCLWLLKTRFHWLNLVPILLYVGYRSWCGWARWTILLFFVIVTLQYCWFRRCRWLPLWALAAALPIFALFNILGHNRAALQGYLKEGTLQGDQFLVEPGISSADIRKKNLDTQDFANFDYLAAVTSIVPARTGTFTYGTQYLQLFTEPIPRILWRGKPAGAPVGFFNLNNYANFIGLTLSLVGDGWVSGGWLGLIITMTIAGTILGLAHRNFWAKANFPIVSMLYISFLGISPNWFRDGGISVFKFLMFTWLPLLLLPVIAWLLNGSAVRARVIQLRSGDRLRLIYSGTRPKGGNNE